MRRTVGQARHAQGPGAVWGARLAGGRSEGGCVGCQASRWGRGGGRGGAHTHHRPDSPGSRCVACHMPYLQEPEIGRTVRYARSDHTVAIPRPAFDDSLGIGNACGQCHGERTAAALDAQVRAWWGGGGGPNPPPPGGGGILRGGRPPPEGPPPARRFGGPRGFPGGGPPPASPPPAPAGENPPPRSPAAGPPRW